LGLGLEVVELPPIAQGTATAAAAAGSNVTNLGVGVGGIRL
jgi:hypothetical protein